MKARLSKNKHDHAFLRIKYLFHINIVTHCILEKLLEFLFFYAKVISLSHFFLHNFFNLLNQLFHFHLYIIHRLFSIV